MEARRANVTFRLDPEGVSIRSHPKGSCEIGLSSDRRPPMRSSYAGALVTLSSHLHIWIQGFQEESSS